MHTANYGTAEREGIGAEQCLLPQPLDVGRYLISGTVTLGDHSFPWSIWDGQPLRRHFALDTETTLLADHQVPRLAMVSVSDGLQHFIVRPGDLADFLLMHLPPGYQVVCHNVAFDFWVLDHELADTGDYVARNWLWSAVDQQRVHDTMLLAGLVSLAETDQDIMPSLAEAVQRYCGYQLEKDTYRTRYAEALGHDWSELDPGFFGYAAADAIATYQLYCRLTAAAKQITDQAGTKREFGFLTEGIQVKAAIVLAAVHRTGIHIDLDLAAELRQDIDQQIQVTIETLLHHAGPDLFHRYKRTGKPKCNKKSGLPKMNCIVLAEELQSVAAEFGIQPPTTKTGKVTTSVNEFWTDFRGQHPLIDAYCQYTELTKLRTFFDKLTEPVIHPRYRVFVRSGRTSCSGPNVQQLPGGSRIREVVTARPGHLLLVIDYSSVELRTLAAVCYSRYGFSKLGDVIKQGIDPHSYTAAMFAGVDLETFQRLHDAKQLRQQAKAINFGFPGGLGAKSLVAYAKHSYGVDITPEQAAEFRIKLTEELYPELKLYLSEDSATVLASSLQADVLQVQQCWPQPYHYGMLKKITQGNYTKADGTPYTEHTIDWNWHQLQQLNCNPQLVEAIATRDTSVTSPLRRLMFTAVTTPTGRIRGRVSFTAARNTPFQGLAADGAKLAMWELLKADYQIVAFVHDEFVIELPMDADHTREAKRIDKICCRSMEQVTGTVPIECEYSLSYCWSKDAEAVWDGDGKLVPWSQPARISPCNFNPPAPSLKTIVKCDPPERTAANISPVSPNHHLDTPQTDVFVGDCRELLPKLAVQPNLIFADPPFNIGEDYGTWNDNLSWSEYVEFTYEWIDTCLTVLSPHGSIWINVPDEIVAEIVMHLKHRGLDMINWIPWHYRFGQWRNTNFIRSKDFGLHFARDRKNRVWNWDAVMVPSNRATKYNDKRTWETKTPGMRVPFDIWGLPDDGPYWGKVQGNNKERRPNHQNQLPEFYLVRVIKALSNEGDLVLDPFAGSGTTGTVARALKRRSVGIEIDPQNAASAFERMKSGMVRDVKTVKTQ